MRESQKLSSIRQVIKQDRNLQDIVECVRSLQGKYNDFSAPLFRESEDFKNLYRMIENLEFQSLESVLPKMKAPDSMLVIPLANQENFGIFFIIMPQNHCFDWHDHPKMIGLSKCLYGEMESTALNPSYLKPTQKGTLSYPLEKLRKTYLRADISQIANVDPDEFNVHQLKATKLSAVLDVMLPNYPENNCGFYNLNFELQTQLHFQKVEESQEKLQLLDSYIQKTIKEQKMAKNAGISL